MAIQSIPCKGLRLNLNEYKQTRAFSDGGYFWDPQHQQIIRQYLGEFLPGVILGEGNESGFVLFCESSGSHRYLSKSTPMGNRPVPKELVENLERAWQSLKSVGSESKVTVPGDPEPQEHAKRIIEEFRLPNPYENPDLYRLSGPIWARKLHILWGCEQNSNTSVSPDAVIDTLARRTSIRVPWWLWLLLALLLAVLLWNWLRPRLPFIPPPVFSPPSGTYADPLQVQISTSTPNAEIRFSFDNDSPNGPDRFVYTAPLVLLKTTTIYAVAVSNGVSSAENTATYVITDEMAETFDLPLLANPVEQAPQTNIIIPQVTPQTNNPFVPPPPPVTNATPPIPKRHLDYHLPFADDSVDSANVRFLGHPNGGPDGQNRGWCFMKPLDAGAAGSSYRYLIDATDQTTALGIKPGEYEVRVVEWANGTFRTDTQRLKFDKGDVAFDNTAAGSMDSLLRLDLLKQGAVQTGFGPHFDSPELTLGSPDSSRVAAEAVNALTKAANDPNAESRPNLWDVDLPDELGGRRELNREQLDVTIAWLKQADPSESANLDFATNALEARMQNDLSTQ